MSLYGFSSEKTAYARPWLLADVLEQARTHASAEHRVQYIAGEAILVRDRVTRHAEADVHLLQILLGFERDSGVGRGRGFRGGSGRAG